MSQNSSVAKTLRVAAWPAAIILACAALLAGVPFALRAVRAAGGPSMTAPVVASTTETGATITWSTNPEGSSIVQYGTTSSLGLEQRNINFNGPGEPETDEMRFSHSVTLMELSPGTTYFFRAKSDTDPSTTVDEPSTVSGISQFTTKSSTPTCTADTWDCSAYGTCSADGTQARTCTLKTDCPTAQTAKPPESQTCTPTCTADTWDCTTYGECKADGTQTRTCTLKSDCAGVTTAKPPISQKCSPSCTADRWNCDPYPETCRADGTQTRTCKLEFDCPNVTTPQPPTSQKCTPPTTCTADRWSCDPYAETCRADGTQTRTCKLEFDCPNVTTPEPPTSQKCSPGQPQPPCTADRWNCDPYPETCRTDGTKVRTCKLEFDCPGVDTPSPELTTTCTTPTQDANEPRDTTSPAGTSHTVVWDSQVDLGTTPGSTLSLDLQTAMDDLSFSIGKSDWSPDQPSKKMGTPVSDLYASIPGGEECKAAGVNAIRCSTWLAAKYADRTCHAAGIQTRESCEAYLTKNNGGVFPGCKDETPAQCEHTKALALIGYLTAELRDKTDKVVDQGMKDGVVVSMTGITAFSTGILDKVAWYPSADGGSKESSSALIILDSDRDGLPDGLEKKLGLDPHKADTDGDGKPDGKVTREILKGYLERGDKPTQPQFATLLDSLLNNRVNPTDIAIINGLSLQQPLGNGQTDETFTVVLETPMGGSSYMPNTDPNAPAIGIGGDPNQPADSTFVVPHILEKSSVTPNGNIDPNDPRLQDQAVVGGDPNQPASEDLLGGRSAVANGSSGLAQGTESDCRAACARQCGANASCLTDCNAGCRARFSAVGMPAGGRKFEDDTIDITLALLSNGGTNSNSSIDIHGAPPEPGVVSLNTAPQALVNEGALNLPYAPEPNGTRDDIPKPKPTNVLRGHAAPRATVLLYIYSYVPMVLTTTTDANGNYAYDLGSGVADGEHTVYVAVTDDTGKITKKSNPLSFFVSQANAASEADFLKPDVTPTTEPVADLKRYYIIGTIALIVVAATIAMSFVMGPKRKTKA